MKTYNGHKNYNYWNVALWLSNDYGLYQSACDAVRRCKNIDDAARQLVDDLHSSGFSKTPDGAPYTVSAVRAAIRDWR